MTSPISIEGLDKAEVLLALVNGSRPVGMGHLNHNASFNIGHAQNIIDDRLDSEFSTLRFDYVNGVPLKVDISGDSFDPRLYDRDAGQGAAQRAIDALLDRLTSPEASS